MDVDRLLNIQKRTGVKDDEIEDFNRKVDDVQSAIQGLLNGTINPDDIKIDGIESEEEKRQKEIERQKRLQIQREKEEKLRLQRKHEERERWWTGAEVFKPKHSSDDNIDHNRVVVSDIAEEAEENRNRIIQRYTADYSKWNEWVPNDEATLAEKAEQEKAEEEAKNREFEKNNAEFCEQFKEDMAKRKEVADKKQESANILRLKGNRYFQARQYDQALELYMQALKDLPFDYKTVGNIAQVYIKQKNYEDALEFLERTLYLDPSNIKALSRKALVLGEQGNTSGAIGCITRALQLEPTNKDLQTQQRELNQIQIEKEQEVKATAALNSQSELNDDRNESSLSNMILKLQQLIHNSDGTIEDENYSEVMTIATAASKIVSVDDNARVIVRTSGVLKIVISASHVLCGSTQSDLRSTDTSTVSQKEEVLCALLHLVAKSVEKQRASKLLILDAKLLSAVKTLIKDVPLTHHWNLLDACLQLFATCGGDDTSVKAQAAVVSDKNLLCFLGSLLGNVSFNQITRKETEQSSHIPSMFCICAELLKVASFSEMGMKALNDIDNAGAASIVCGCAVAIHCTLHHFPTNLTNSSHNRTSILQDFVDASVGLSQMEVLRSAFAMEMPVESSTKPKKPKTVCMVGTLLEVGKTLSVFATNTISAIMNACLEPNGATAVRQSVVANGGQELALSGLADSMGTKQLEEDEMNLLVRKAGLLSRLATTPEIQNMLKRCDTYRLLCRRIAKCVTIDNDSKVKRWIVEERNHHIRTLASLSNPGAACLKIGIEEGIIDALLDLLPTPREECGEITARSVTLMPHDLPTPLLLGNAARCLMPYADNFAEDLYAVSGEKAKRRKCIEKLVCSMASCPDMRVRKNIAILLAKGCRVAGVRDKVTELRGMQMLIELQDKL